MSNGDFRAHTDERAMRELAHALATAQLNAGCGSASALNGRHPAADPGAWAAASASLEEHGRGVLDATLIAHVAELGAEFVNGRGPLFDQRANAGMVITGGLEGIDHDSQRSLDFSGPHDVLADAAAVALDAELRGEWSAGQLFLRDYASQTADPFPSSLLHHLVAFLAVQRCQAVAHGTPDGAADAARLLDIAYRHLVRGRVTWLLVGGPPGVGKSTLASGLADALGWAVLRHDDLRGNGVGDRSHGVSEWMIHHLGDDEGARAAYRQMIRRAAMLSAYGESVVLDASWPSSALREMAAVAAAEAHCPLLAVRCDAPSVVAEDRVARRIGVGGDVSRVAVAIARQAATAFDPWPNAVRVDTVAPITDAVDSATALVARQTAGRGTLVTAP